MSTLEKVSELESLKAAIENSCNEDAKKEAFSKGKLTARDRIKSLLDENSFVEIGAFIKSRSTAFNMQDKETPADGVICGYGTIQGNLVYVYSQDSTVLGGAIGEMHAKKIVRTYEDAIKMGVPIISLIDTAGIRLQEYVDALDGYGSLFKIASEASGVIPQICGILGDCAGGASFIAGLSDFVFIASNNGKMYLNSPNTFDDKSASFDSVASAKIHAEESGLAHFIAEKEEDLLGGIRTLITYLPSNNNEEPPCYHCEDDLNRTDASLNDFEIGKNSITDIIISLSDNSEYLEVSKQYGQAAFIGFIRMDGSTVGIVANKEPVADYAAVKKMTQFVTLCDAFNIPIITLTNIERFESTPQTEKLGMIKECSKLTYSFASATVPKINLILGTAYGSAYVAMNSKHIGADYVYAWPTAKVSALDSECAVRIMYDEEIRSSENAINTMTNKITEFEEMNSSAYAVAARGYIDDIIEPAATRKRLMAALEVLSTKQVDSLY